MHLPNWLLTIRDFNIAFTYKAFNEIFNWLIVIFYALFFISVSGFMQSRKFGGPGSILSKIKEETQNKLNSMSLQEISLYALGVAFIAALCFPADSSDLFGYIARGAQQAVYHRNPYAETVANIDDWHLDPLLANTHWQDNLSPYGPLFMLVCRLVIFLAGANLWLALLIFKLFNFAIFAAFLYLSKKVLNEFFLRNNLNQIESLTQKQIYILFALNPFLVNEVLWNAHNDILMALLIFSGIYLAYTKHFNWAVILIGLATLTKYLSLVLLPLVLLYAGKEYLSEHRKFDIKSFAAFFPLKGLAAAALLAGFLVWHYQLLSIDYTVISDNLTLSHKSLFDVFNSIYKYLAHYDLPNAFKFVFLGLYAIYYVLILFTAYYTKAAKHIFAYAFLLLFVLICFASPKFHSWYLVMFLPLGLLVNPRLVFLLSFAHLFSLTFIDQANILNFLLLTALPVYIYGISASSPRKQRS
jgi:alpha-1,6-mannosyltransferase